MIDQLIEQFSDLEDPRCAGKVEHQLHDSLVIAIPELLENTLVTLDAMDCQKEITRPYSPRVGIFPQGPRFSLTPTNMLLSSMGRNKLHCRLPYRSTIVESSPN